MLPLLVLVSKFLSLQEPNPYEQPREKEHQTSIPMHPVSNHTLKMGFNLLMLMSFEVITMVTVYQEPAYLAS